jgi:hypothetical protein
MRQRTEYNKGMDTLRIRALRIRTVVALVATMLAVSTPALINAQPPADAVPFATDVEKARAHLLVSEELYAAGQAGPAGLHAAHPIHELGNRLVAPLRRVDGAAADRLRDTLKEPGRAIQAKVPPAQYGTTVASVGKALDDAVTRVVGADTRATPAFRAGVLATLIAGLADEYDEAFKDGRITQVVEYQDAYGFFRRAKTLYDALPPDARRADADIASLAKAFPSREPPKTPLPAKAVKDLTQRIGTALTK